MKEIMYHYSITEGILLLVMQPKLPLRTQIDAIVASHGDTQIW